MYPVPMWITPFWSNDPNVFYLKIFSVIYFYIVCISVCLHVCMCITCVPTVCGDEGGDGSSGTRGCRQFWATMWKLELNRLSSSNLYFHELQPLHLGKHFTNLCRAVRYGLFNHQETNWTRAAQSLFRCVILIHSSLSNCHWLMCLLFSSLQW